MSLQQLYQRIWLGGFPALNEQGPPARELFFRSYVQTYLQRDVPELLRVSDLLAFNRFLAATAARTGQLLNIASIARDVDIDHKTAGAWLSLLEASGLVYPCTCTRREIADSLQPPDAARLRHQERVYPGTCRTLKNSDIENRLAEGKPFQWRLDHQKAMKQTGPVSWSQFDIETGRTASIPVQLDRWGDVVLVRKDIPTTYHLSVVVDDSIQGITHIVRGQDLEAATDIHATLQSLLLLKPPLYIHHPLLRDDAGEKLSKSRLSRSLRDERSEGLTLARLKRELGFSESRE